MSISERLKKIMTIKGLRNAPELARKTNLSRQATNDYLTKDRQPNFDALLKIKTAFPDLNMNWLIDGSGEMLLKEVGNNISNSVVGSSISDSSIEQGDAKDESQHIKDLQHQVEEKDKQIQEKDKQIQEKDKQIQKLLDKL